MTKKLKKEKDLPEELVINIIARLPLQSIVRFKWVCREWKSHTESAFFRDLYQSNSNSDWSILHGNYRRTDSYLEELKLDLPNESPHGTSFSLSFSSFFAQNNKNKMEEIRVVACTDGLVLLRLKSVEEDMMIRYYIGNPVLAQWIQLPPSSPPPPFPYDDFNDSGLVTKTHDGALIGYKVVRIHVSAQTGFFVQSWNFDIFSSDTGEWSVKQFSCPADISVSLLNTSNPVSLNGKLHWLGEPHHIIVHDLFSNDDQVRVICLPARMQGTKCRWHKPESLCHRPSPCVKMILTTSQGYCVLIDAELILDDVENYNVRIWRLKSDSWNWEKAWEINMARVGFPPTCVPMAINCFDIDIIYLWDLDNRCFIACNLRTHTKSYGTRKDGVVYNDPKRFIASVLPKFHRTRKDGSVYKEDTFCFEPSSCLSQFVPSLQALPTI